MIRYIVSMVIVISLIITSSTGVLAGDKIKTETPIKFAIASKVSNNRVAVDENILMSLVTMPAYHIEKARECFLKKNSKEITANEIRMSEVFVSLEAERTTTEASKEALLDVAKQLDKFASDIEKGSVSSIGEFDNNVLLASKGLANYNAKMADMLLDNNKIVRDDPKLKAATGYTQHGYSWSVQRVKRESDKIKSSHEPRVATDYTQHGYSWSVQKKEKKSDGILISDGQILAER